MSAIPLSIDLWIHHIQFVEERFENQPNKEEMVRSMYEKALTAAGTDFRSDKLWEMYITWEKELGNLKNATALYDRILVIPTQMYKHHFDQFQEHVKQNLPKDILPLDDFLKLRQQVMVKNPVAQPVLPGDEDGEEQPAAVDEAPPGEEAPPGLGGEDATIDIDKETSDLRDKIIESRQERHQLNEQEVSKRWAFEEAIRRPYFHVKPLEKGQVKNWREYLEFEMENGSHERVLVLFERCVIACAMYEEFWVKYAKYLEPHSVDGARNVYTRACTIHLVRKATLHIAWAAFEERQDQIETALKIITDLEVIVSGLVMVSLKRISLYRRMGRLEEVEELYQKYIESGDANVASFYSMRYSRFLAKITHNTEKAKKVLIEALEKDEKNHKLYLQLIDLEYQKENMDENVILETIDLALKSNLALEHKVALSRRKLEFLEDFGSQVTRSVEAYSEHQALVKEMQLSKKRKTTDSGSTNPEKKQKTDNSYSHQYNTNGTGDQTQKHYNQNHNMGHEDYSAYGYGAWGNYQNYNYPQGWGGYNSGYYGQQ